MVTNVEIVYLKHVTVTTTCPACGASSTSDKGTCRLADLKPTQYDWCDEHGQYEVDIDWAEEFRKLLERSRE